jgi:hypothetical protein
LKLLFGVWLNERWNRTESRKNTPDKSLLGSLEVGGGELDELKVFGVALPTELLAAV